MTYSVLKLNANDISVSVHRWKPTESPIGCIQIIHGMMEHGKRYNELATFLNSKGFIVYCLDQRGHGLTSQTTGLGILRSNTTWMTLLSDFHLVTQHIKQESPSLPYFILGHSMGSYEALHYSILHPTELTGLILSGTSYEPPFLTSIGGGIASLACRLFDASSPASVIHYLTFLGYNSEFTPAKTGYEWLCSDPQVVNAYIKDPLCGAPCSRQFFSVLFSGLKRLFSKETLSQFSEALPLLILTGDKDPLAGKNITKVRQLISLLETRIKTPITHRIYPEGRHECLNEAFKTSVFEDIYEWIQGIS